MEKAPALTLKRGVQFRQRLHRLTLDPRTILFCLIAGAACGVAWPQGSQSLSIISSIYVDLLKMIILPFMISAVIFSLQRLFKDGGAAQLLSRVVWVFVFASLIAAALGVLGATLIRPGADLSPANRVVVGQIVGGEVNQNNTDMVLGAVDEPAREASLGDVVASLIPSNAFTALVQGDTLKVLVIALLFGFAVGKVPEVTSESLTRMLDTVYQACQTLTHWLNHLVPFVLFAVAAKQMALTGLEPIIAMGGFMGAFVVVIAVLLALSLLILQRRSGQSWRSVVHAMQAPFAMAIATRSSACCMPALIEALAGPLRFARSRVELLVPLSVSILRAGTIVYYATATLFIAQLYGRSLTPFEIGVLVLVTTLASFASVGMSGVATVSQVGITCGYLGLPFEAVFILLVAVDLLGDAARTVLNVVGNAAAVAVICPAPARVDLAKVNTA